MCGIVGIAQTRNAPPLGVEAVRRMADTIRHRGPDDEGFFAPPGERVVLGMRRLSIIDLAGGHQPIANEDETVWVVCNGEIYNFREVRADLEKRGHRFRTHSDVEVLVHLYEEYGDDFIEHVSGMYGFALWDTRRKRLTMARDRLGQKPLYFLERGGTFAFASEIKALLALPGVSPGLDKAVLREYLAMGYSVAPRTLFAGIHKLPPATRLVWQDGRIETSTYWSIPDSVREDVSEASWIERIRAELERAVTEHMVSDVPLGAFLSGGIDSSAVVALMSRSSSGPVNTYSIGYAGDGAASYFNELSYAGVVARRFATHHTEIPVEPDVAALLPRLMWHLEEPISDSAIVTTWLVSELAARSVKVILSGVGGDELFGGYRRYLGEHYVQRYRRIPRWVRQQIVRPLARALPSGRQSRVMDLARYAKKFIHASELTWQQQYRIFMEICAADQLARLMVDGSGSADGFDRVLSAETASDSLLRLFRVDAQAQLPEDLLLLTDKVTMATSIECRVPFLDHRLVETAATIPASIKMRDGELKHLLKRALQGVVPDEILYRSKRGFGAPIGIWFQSDLRALRDSLLSRSVIESRGILSWPAVREVVARHDANREDYTDLLLVLVNLEIWCRIFLDGASPGDVGDELAELTLAA
jgi:asparagine synthase (glutamine-hydrolysing)